MPPPASLSYGGWLASSTVAVLDTGIDQTHPGLAGRVAARANFTEGAEVDRDPRRQRRRVRGPLPWRRAGRDAAGRQGLRQLRMRRSWILTGTRLWTVLEDVGIRPSGMLGVQPYSGHPSR
jgi:hypothetical protein